MTGPLVGILGGMGPAATAYLYERIIALTPARTDQEHLAVVIWADPSVPDRTEALLRGGADPTATLVAGATRLREAGAELVAIACNTAHAFAPAIEAAAGAELISMIGVTVAALTRDHPAAETVAVLATAGTVRTGLYHERLASAGLTPAPVPDELQRQVDTVIAAVKAGDTGAGVRDRWTAITRRCADSGAQVALAACTELSVLVGLGANAILPVVDSTESLAAAVVARALELRAAAA